MYRTVLGNRRRKTVDEARVGYRKRIIHQEILNRRTHLREQLHQRQRNLNYNDNENIDNENIDNENIDNENDDNRDNHQGQDENHHDNQNENNRDENQVGDDHQGQDDNHDNQNEAVHDENLDGGDNRNLDNRDENQDGDDRGVNNNQHCGQHHDPHDDVDRCRRGLAIASVTTNMNKQQTNAILQVVRDHGCFITIPKDARTLLATPRTPALIYPMAGGQYLDLGLENACQETLKKTPGHLIPRELLFDFSTDGALLDKGKKGNVWPIQIRIVNIPHSSPEFVGIWVTDGHCSKPTNSNQFLSRFVNEYRQIVRRNGIIFNNEIIRLTPRTFIADGPGRAMVLCHKGHAGYSACSRCTIVGIPAPGKRKVIFFDRNIILRTERDYFNQIDHEHHSVGPRSILHRIPGFQVVNNTVFDIMHAVFLGLCKQFFAALVIGKYNKNLQLNEYNIELINVRLTLISDFCPREFSRHPVNIKNYSQQKATECRQQLLHTGFIFLRGIIHPAIYTHFLKLATALKILVRPATENEIIIAEKLLVSFVKGCNAIYGLNFYTYNCHILLHLGEDARRFGPLDSISAFKYENNLQYFSHCIKKPHQYLQQIRNRRAEISALQLPIVINNQEYTPGKKWYENNLPLFIPANTLQYRTLKCPKYLININDRDNTLILNDSSLCIVQNIINYNGEFQLLVKRFIPPIESFFNVGWPSILFGVYKCTVLSDVVDLVRINEVRGKCFRMPYFDGSNSLPTPNHWIISVMTSTVDDWE